MEIASGPGTAVRHSLAPHLRSSGCVKGIRRRRLTPYLSESRILVGQVRLPLVSILLSLAKTVVEGGSVRNALEYYKELANESSPWIAVPQLDAGPLVKIYQICSREVRKLTAALALCPEGVRTDRGETVQIVVLISAPANSVPSFLALLAEVVRLLESRPARESLLRSRSSSDARSILARLESATDSSPHTWNSAQNSTQ